MTSSSLRIISKIKKIRYLFHLIVQYFINSTIPQGSKNMRPNAFNIKEWQKLLIKTQPILELFQAINDKEEIISEKFCNVLTYKGYGYL